jgi:toxin secretion/phage lysis holin
MGENDIKGALAAFGATLGFLPGGGTPLYNLLLAAIVIDWITGICAAAIEGKLKSRRHYYGTLRKFGIIAIVTLCHFIDLTLGDAHYTRDVAIMFYLVNEIISVTENAARMKLPVPGVLLEALEVMKEKVNGKDKKGENKDAGKEQGERSGD